MNYNLYIIIIIYIIIINIYYYFFRDLSPASLQYVPTNFQIKMSPLDSLHMSGL